MKEKHKLKIQKRIEEEQKCKENEAKFCAWLEGKRQQAKLRYLRNQQIKAASSQPYYAPTAHLYVQLHLTYLYHYTLLTLMCKIICLI